MSSLVQIYQCECNPNFIYKTKQYYQKHFQSIRHKNWQNQYDDQTYRKRIVELENIISSLKLENIMWKEMAMRLKQQYEPTNLLD